MHPEVSPKALGYGTTALPRIWDALAEVSGRIVWAYENLREGAIISKGTELLRIYDSEYKLVLSQINAQLNTFKVKADTTRRSLAVEKRSQLSFKKKLSARKNLV